MQQASRELVAHVRAWGKRSRSRVERRQLAILNIAPADDDARVQRVEWFSPALGIAKHLHIYLPSSYACEDARYPVLFLLRGHEREWLRADEDGSRKGCNVIDVYEELLRQGEVGPMILVMPGMTSDDGRVHGIGIDALKPWRGLPADGVGSGLWETYFRDDVITLVDSYWRTLGTGAHRGVDGFSLGGAMALKFAAKFPGLFRTAGAFDGTFLYADGAGVRGDDPLLANPIWGPALGQPCDLQHAAANNAPSLVQLADGMRLGAITWMVQYGPEHVEPWGSNFYRGVHLLEALARRGIRNAVDDPVIAHATHTWANADQHMRHTLPVHWRQLRAS